MNEPRQAGESLTGHYLSWRLHPFSVKKLCDAAPGETIETDTLKAALTADAALAHLLKRGGSPEPCLLLDEVQADCWRDPYANGLVREDVLEFSRLQEVGAMRVLLELSCSRVGSPLSFASLYFLDVGMVAGDSPEADGARLENAVAVMLLKQVHFLQDSAAKPANLHCVRTTEGTKIDFALSSGDALSHLIECKWTDSGPHPAFNKIRPMWLNAQAIQLVNHLRNDQVRNGPSMVQAARWLARLAA